jgi:uridine kinase
MNPTIIGVAGGSGSGKTTVSMRILERVGAPPIAYIQHDSYYFDNSHLPPDERARMNYDHPDSLDTPLLIEHLRALRAGQGVDVPTYDFSTHSRRPKTVRVDPQPVILVEGILIFVEKELRELMDVRIFVDADSDLRFIRRLQRDVHERGRSQDSVVEQYLRTVRPMHLEFVEPSKRYADVIIPEGGYNEVALAMIESRLRAMLGEGRGARGE